MKPFVKMPSTHMQINSAVQKQVHSVTKVKAVLGGRPMSRMEVYTDGSKRAGQAGAAACIQIPGAGIRLVGRQHLGELTSSEAEYVAADLGLRFVAEMLRKGFPLKKVVIKADFLAICNLVNGQASCTSSTHPWAKAFGQRLDIIRQKYPTVSVTASHSPAHSGIVGNVRADQAAKAGARGETGVDVEKP